LPTETARLLAFQSELGDFYEAALSGDGPRARVLANWTTNELRARIGDADPAGTPLDPAAFARLVEMVAAKEVSASAGKEVLDVLVSEGGDPAAVVESRGLGRAGEDELGAIVDRAIAENEAAVEKIREGKVQAIGAIVGAVMRETKGRADGGEVQRMIRERIEG
jgi:aspartyl-tRNA(Asn)/glutamyl-tRNA(Gln) amidotransferase subunit B